MSYVGINVGRLDHVGVSAGRVGRVAVTAGRVGRVGVGVGVSMVCDTGKYMVVTPSFLWVTTEWLDEDIEVKSNTDWTVG